MKINKFILLLLFVSILNVGKSQYAGLSNVPGIVVTHYSSESKTFVGTPSLCIMPDGTYLCSHNTFGVQGNKTFIYKSADKGESWKKIASFSGVQYQLFYHNNDLYAMGVDSGLGSCVIRKSLDRGNTWTEPVDEKSGLLRKDDFEKGYHSSAVSVVVAKGRIWRPYELMRKKGWGNFEALMLSASVESDLLNAESWVTSNRISVDESWGNNYRTWLEGGAVLSPTGEVLDFLRVDKREEEYAAMIHVSDDGKKLSIDPKKDFLKFPGGCKKFVVRYDSISSKYWSLTNWVPEEFEGYDVERTRNTLALISSNDLKDWTVHKIVLQDENIEKSGFQYVDWQIENDDIIFVSRTAFFDGKLFADSQHNANFMTFHRINKFRSNIDFTLEIIRNHK